MNAILQLLIGIVSLLPLAQADSPKPGEVLVRIETSFGNIDLAIDTARAPITAENFLKYVDGGFYDGGRFHRATRADNYKPNLPNRPLLEIIQAGINPARKGDGFPAIPLERTSKTGLTHVVGTVSMPRGQQADSGTSGFVIHFNDQPSLNHGGMRFDDGQGTAAFGRVVAGMDVARKIQQQPVREQALDPPVIITRAFRREPSVAPGANDRYATAEGRAMTVQILEGEGRDQYQKPDEVIRHMALKEGDVVCEIGAGTGYFTPFLSKAVGSSGKVYAEDPQAEFLELLKKKKEALGLRNVEVVRGTYTDTNLPDRVCDVTFVLDTYHHFEWPKPMLDAMKRDTKPTGRLVIVDFYRRPNEFFLKWKIDAMQHLRLDVDGVIEEVSQHGWTHVETLRFLDYQYFAVFTPR